ncbi:MAG: TIGR04372 family glycosyltransferase, partial [Desulfobacteraceae bacterium]|nr:TIGR04372 family glycosyltransferase [Desulfobacteraceae bacterium]
MSFYNSLKFKVGVIHSDSIGKLLAHTEYYLRKQASKDNLETSFFVAGKPILPYALKMYRRKTIIFQNHFFYIFFKKMQEFFPELNCWADLNRNGFYDWKIWDESAPQLEFNKKDLQKGSRLLMRMGIGHEAEYVCVHIRDNKYSDSFKKRDPWWEDNDFRDCSAENYLSVIEYLAQKGIYTIRLGNADSPPINVKNKYFIDYATRYQSAFGDVFLPGTCKFLLGNPSGVYFLATVFNVPVA